ncbi:MAG: hypothetical protein ACLQCB_04590 [Spirochaetia bacterium]
MSIMDWLHSLIDNPRLTQASLLANTLVALAALIAVLVGLGQLNHLLALKREEKRLRRQQAARTLIVAYLAEYRSPQMGRAIASLWDLYRLARRNPRELVRLYIRLYKKDRNHAFHFEVRRRVSVFFQHLAFLVEQEESVREETYRYWTKSNLELIPKVLLPLETFAVPEILSGYRSEESKENFILDTSPQRSLKAMEELYSNAPEKHDVSSQEKATT